jgi:hypothetical protein
MKFRVLRKDTKLAKSDYVFDDTDKFALILPYLKPKLNGDWAVAIVEPPIDVVRNYIRADNIPPWLNVTVYMEKGALSQLFMEFSHLSTKEPSPWEKYIELIKEFDVPMEDKAMREIYYRAGPSTESLTEALELFRDLEFVRMPDVNKRLLPVRRVYARQVLIAFLQKDKYAWKKYSQLENELGVAISFFAMRKYLRKLLNEKNAYLRNKPVTDKAVTSVDIYTIIHAYLLFETASSEKQLPSILSCIERRILPC